MHILRTTENFKLTRLNVHSPLEAAKLCEEKNYIVAVHEWAKTSNELILILANGKNFYPDTYYDNFPSRWTIEKLKTDVITFL